MREYKQGVDRAKREMRGIGDEADKTTDRFRGLDQALTAVGSNAALYGLKNLVAATTAEATKLHNSVVGLASVAESFGEDVDAATRAAQSLAEDGLAPVSTYASALKSLLATGIGLDRAVELIEMYKDRAAFGRSESIAFSNAVENLAESFKTESSTIGDLSGQAENYSIILQRGLAVMQERGQVLGKSIDQLTEAERAEAKYFGTMAVGAPFVGDAAKLTEEFSGRQAQLNAKWVEAKQAVGEALLPVLDDLMAVITPIVAGSAKWIAENKELVAGMLAATATMTGLVAVLSTAIVVVNAVRAAVVGLNMSLKGPAGLIIGLGTAIASFVAFGAAASAASDSLMESGQAADQQAKAFNGLLAEYETLNASTERSAAEQERLQTVMNEIRDIAPDVVRAYDEYGNAIEINTDRAREYNAELEKTAQIKLALAAQEAEEELPKVVEQIAKAQERVNALLAENTKWYEEQKALAEEIDQVEAQIAEKRAQIVALKEQDGVRNREQIDTLENEVALLESVNTDRRRSLNELNAQLKSAKELTAETRNQLDEETSHLAKLQEKKAKYERILGVIRGITNEMQVWHEKQAYLEKKYGKQAGTELAGPPVPSPAPRRASGSGGGTRKSAEDIAMEQYRAQLKTLDYRKQMNQLTEQEELASLERLLAQYGKYESARMDLDVRIYRQREAIRRDAELAEQEAQRASYDHSAKWIATETQRLRDKGATEVEIADMQIAAWERVRNRYDSDSEHYKRADAELYGARQQLVAQTVQMQLTALSKTRDMQRATLRKQNEQAVADARKAIDGWRAHFDQAAESINARMDEVRDKYAKRTDAIRGQADALDAQLRKERELYDAETRRMQRQELLDRRQALVADKRFEKVVRGDDGTLRTELTYDTAAVADVDRQLADMQRQDALSQREAQLQQRKMQLQSEIDAINAKRDAELQALQAELTANQQARDEKLTVLNNELADLQSTNQQKMEAFETYWAQVLDRETVAQDVRNEVLQAGMEVALDNVKAHLNAVIAEYERSIQKMVAMGESVSKKLARKSSSGGGGGGKSATNNNNSVNIGSLNVLANNANRMVESARAYQRAARYK